jgi:hypothetical protein
MRTDYLRVDAGGRRAPLGSILHPAASPGHRPQGMRFVAEAREQLGAVSPGKPPPESGELFAVFPFAAIPAPGLTPPKGRAASQNRAQDKTEHIPHFRPPQVAAGDRRPHGADGLRFHPDGILPSGYILQGIYRMGLLPHNVSSVNIWLILLNADGNGLRSSLIPRENHFPKPCFCGILKDNKLCNLTTQYY